MNRLYPPALVAATLASLPLPLFAQPGAAEAGDWILRGGLTYVAPNDHTSSRNGELAPALAGTDVAVSSEPQFGVTAAYLLTDNLAVELLAATPFEHDLTLAGGALDGVPLGDIKHLPPTLSLQYRFDTESAITPYVGLGLNYTFFFSEDVSDQARALSVQHIKLDDSFGPAAQVGLDYALTDHWLISADVRYLHIQTTAELRTATGTTHVDVDIDPWVYTLAAGYHF
ncbi:OmpW/AlkL family protein [Salinisphaera orenii]|uniref:Outer membrane protein W n=1 Tax=Salinisphaera orenii YIM 95161 TaxID=1051139 RepID=A0A423QAK8_9GAMM|nr:OmpW family outer membrane protein [Salinisphaera halophila]ROO37621.1 outer membrane protein W [Salinisphaera halophila YIM 95161]